MSGNSAAPDKLRVLAGSGLRSWPGFTDLAARGALAELELCGQAEALAEHLPWRLAAANGQSVSLSGFSEADLLAGSGLGGGPRAELPESWRRQAGLELLGACLPGPDVLFGELLALARSEPSAVLIILDLSQNSRGDRQFLALGPGIASGQSLGRVSGADLFATLAYVLDLPLPGDCPGRVLLEIFEPWVLPLKPLRFSDEPLDCAAGPGEAGNERAEILESMRALGYL